VSITVIETPFGIRWTSLATAVGIVLVVTVVRRRPLLGVVAAMGWGTTFEVVFQITSILAHRDTHWLRALAGESWWLWTVVGWSFAAHLAGVRPRLSWVLVTAALFALWIQQGFWFNWQGQTTPVNWWYEALNVAAKTALGVAYVLGAVQPRRPRWREARMLGGRLLGMAPERFHRRLDGAR
jgi:hypothetical protein